MDKSHHIVKTAVISGRRYPHIFGAIMRSLIISITLLLATVAFAEDKPSEKAKAELQLLQGNWQKIDSFSKDSSTPDVSSEIRRYVNERTRVRYEGDREVVTLDGVEDSDIKVVIKIDPTKTPKEMDRYVEVGETKEIQRLIYELDGDKLRTAYLKDYTRPKSFDESGIYVCTFKRVKQTQSVIAPPPRGTPIQNEPKGDVQQPRVGAISPTRPVNEKSEPAKKELEKLQGTWQQVGRTVADPHEPKLPANLEASILARMSARFEGNRFIPRFDGKDKNVVITVSLDPTTTPRQMDRVIEHDGKKEIQRLIYELVGDTLRIGLLKDSTARPSGFDAKDVSIVVYDRSKK